MVYSCQVGLCPWKVGCQGSGLDGFSFEAFGRFSDSVLVCWWWMFVYSFELSELFRDIPKLCIIPPLYQVQSPDMDAHIIPMSSLFIGPVSRAHDALEIYGSFHFGLLRDQGDPIIGVILIKRTPTL